MSARAKAVLFLLERSVDGPKDSSGPFTVSLSEDLSKPSKFALAKKADRLLQAVQATVAHLLASPWCGLPPSNPSEPVSKGSVAL